MSNANTAAAAHLAAIRANVEDWYADRISHPEFHARAVWLHAAADAEGPAVRESLATMMRESLRS